MFSRIAKFILLPAVLITSFTSVAQILKDGKVNLNGDGSQYLKFSFTNQLWVRNTDMNPGTNINGYAKKNYTDIGIRRVRLQVFGQISGKVFIYTMIGENNFNFLSDRKAGLCVLDALAEYEPVKTKLSLGAGLTGWGGLSRFSSPAVASFAGIDAPLYQQSTVEVSDQLLRKLSVYAKGKLGKLDYRLALNHPLAVQKSNGYSSTVGRYSSFSAEPAKMQFTGYFQWQMLDKEANTSPYAAGCYLGEKNVFNIGAGFLYQQDAMWRSAPEGNDTIRTPMKHAAIDLFYDIALNKTKKTSLNAYAAFVHYDFGKGHLRNIATMNPANGTTNKNLMNGHGNGYPGIGTGNVLFGQVAYKFADHLVGSTTFMPYAAIQHAKYDRLDEAMIFVDAGISWLLKNHQSKLTLAFQNRPLFYSDDIKGTGTLDGRKNSVILQYSVSFP